MPNNPEDLWRWFAPLVQQVQISTVIEARESRVPLLVLTADRPPELQLPLGQTIDQLKLFGTYPNWQAG